MNSLEKRIYVGNIFQNIDECLAQLHTRFQKFGQCIDKGFENHATFAYITMNFKDEAQLNNLKRTFNNAKFKGNELKVAEAKPDWKTTNVLRREQDAIDNHIKEKQMENKNWEYHKKLENINMSWEDRKCVIPGRIRKTPRSKSQLRNVTFRVDVNDSLKVYKCFKTKLWGYEREKTAKDLVIKFSNNQWRNDYGHIVDRLTYQRSKQPIGQAINSRKETVEQEEVDSAINEKTKVSNVLHNILDTFDFEKPMSLELDDDVDEPQKSVDEINTTSDKFRGNTNKLENHSSTDSHIAPKLDDKVRNGPISLSNAEIDTDEFEPKFLISADKSNKNPDKTETLRTLFNPEAPNEDGFKLIAESDDDIDHQKDFNIQDVAIIPQEVSKLHSVEVQPQLPRREEVQLFFPHLDSPFLVGQTQLAKVKSVYNKRDFENWNDEFWENRGLWMKDAKRRRRDALRQMKKSWPNSGSGVLL